MTFSSIGKAEHSSNTQGSSVAVPITIGGESHTVTYGSSDAELTANPDAFLAAALILAMRAGEPLSLAGPASPMLLQAVPRIQEIFTKWYPEFKPIKVHAEEQAIRETGGSGTGLFFSGGVDSFHTLLRHYDEIDTLIYVHGFDIPLANTELRAKVSEELRAVAQRMGKDCLEVETNLREISDRRTHWGFHYVGSALASVSLLLANRFKKIFIASSLSYEHLDPWGTHVLLDPLWSTEYLTFEHDGCEADRNEKVAAIAESDVAMQSLRVCYENRENEYNCGRCEKCLRTMISLHCVGALERCKTLPSALDPELVAHMDIEHELVFHLVCDNLAELEANEAGSPLTEALRKAAQTYRHRCLARQLKESRESFFLSEDWRGFLLTHKNRIFRSFWESDPDWFFKEAWKEKVKEWDKDLFRGLLRRVYKGRGRQSD